MDQFDDLPDIVEKDNKPKFQTEVSNSSNLNQQVANLFVPLFGDEPTEAPAAITSDQDAAEADDNDTQHATGKNGNQ